MSKVIKMDLSADSIYKAAKELLKYQQELDRKCEIFVDKLAKVGLNVVRQTMESIPSDEKGSYYTEIITTERGDNIKGVAIRLSGEQVLFIEFSAGITYGSDNYPLPVGNEYGMGTYPGKGHWDDPDGWWYRDELGHSHHSYGNRAYMPMYHAETAILQRVEQIAREVFG